MLTPGSRGAGPSGASSGPRESNSSDRGLKLLFRIVGLLGALAISANFVHEAWGAGYKAVGMIVGVGGVLYSFLLFAVGGRAGNVHNFFRLTPSLIYGTLLFVSLTFGYQPDIPEYHSIEVNKGWRDATFSIHGAYPGMVPSEVTELLGEPTGKTWTMNEEVTNLLADECGELVESILARKSATPVFVEGEGGTLEQYRKRLNDFYQPKGIPKVPESREEIGRFVELLRSDNCVVTTVAAGSSSVLLDRALEQLMQSDQSILYFVRLRLPKGKLTIGSDRFCADVWVVKRYPLLTFQQPGIELDYVSGQRTVDSVHGDELFYKSRRILQVGKPMGNLPPDWPVGKTVNDVRFRSDSKNLDKITKIVSFKVTNNLLQVFLEDGLIYKFAVYHERY